MPLAVTHVLLTIILVDFYRDYVTKHKKFFTLHTVFVAGVAGLLPDIDIIFRIISNLFNIETHYLLQHGGFFHTPFFGLLFLVAGLIFLKKKNEKFAMYLFVISFGIMFHIFLDFLFGGGFYEGIMFFWPFSALAFKIHLFHYFSGGDLPLAVDAIILLAWLWHEEVKHKISDFI